MLQALSRRTLIILTVIANTVYIFWRIFYTIPSGEGWISLFFAISLLFIEVTGMGEMFIHFYGMANILIPEFPEIDLDLYPHVDVLIATYNEPVDLVQKTINGCLRMEYPDFDKVHIYVCDDGVRPAMEEICKKMGVGYLIRDEHKHAKAGNLNNAMQFTTSPILVTFDADMIPRHEFLMKTIPYFLKNEQAIKNGEEPNHPKIGFIQTPQCFYNTDLFQFNLHSENRIPNEQDYFYRDVQTAKNATNSVIYGGSNTVISREALNDVGGFYTNSITEDFATGMLIQNKGYRCYALNTALASGLSPDDLKSLIKQRERWGRGCIQTGRRLNLFRLKGLSMGQKLSYLSSITYWYSSIKRFFYIMSPIMYAVFGVIVVDCTLPQVLAFWLPMYILTNATIKKFSNNIRNTRWTNIYETIMFQALMIPVILETFGVSQNKFLVTKKDKSGDTDRSYQIKQALPFTFYIILSIIGIFNMVHLTFVYESPSFVILIYWLFTNLFNLGMAVFFLLGRRQFRQSDRFLAEENCHVQQGTLEVDCTSIDISEDGFALLFTRPEFIDPDQEFTLTFHTDLSRYDVTLKGKIAQVIHIEEGWKYAGYITELSEEDRDEWNAIVHDRLPSLPQTIVESRGFYEDFEINIRRRTHKEAFFSRKTVRLNLNYSTNLPNAGHVWIKNFNYYYMLLEFPNGALHIPDEIFIPVSKNLSLHCQKDSQQFGGNEVLYRIANNDAIQADATFRTEVTDFMLCIYVKDQKIKQRTRSTDRPLDELDLSQFI